MTPEPKVSPPGASVAQAGEHDALSKVVVTKNEAGQIVAVTRQDLDGRILSVIAESAALTPPAAPQEPSDALIADLEQLADRIDPPQIFVAPDTRYNAAKAMREAASALRAAMNAQPSAKEALDGSTAASGVPPSDGGQP